MNCPLPEELQWPLCKLEKEERTTELCQEKERKKVYRWVVWLLRRFLQIFPLSARRLGRGQREAAPDPRVTEFSVCCGKVPQLQDGKLPS